MDHEEIKNRIKNSGDFTALQKRELEALIDEAGWVKCSDRMPEDSQRVLICTTLGTVQAATFHDEGDHPQARAFWTSGTEGWSLNEVTFWKPVPATPFRWDVSLPLEENVFLALCEVWVNYHVKGKWKADLKEHRNDTPDNLTDYISTLSDPIEEEMDAIFTFFYGNHYDIPNKLIREWCYGYCGAFYTIEMIDLMEERGELDEP